MRLLALLPAHYVPTVLDTPITAIDGVLDIGELALEFRAAERGRCRRCE